MFCVLASVVFATNKFEFFAPSDNMSKKIKATRECDLLIAVDFLL